MMEVFEGRPCPVPGPLAHGKTGPAQFDSPVQSVGDSANRDRGHFPSHEHSDAEAVLAAG